MTRLLSAEQVEVIAREGAARITWHITLACPVALSRSRDFNRVRVMPWLLWLILGWQLLGTLVLCVLVVVALVDERRSKRARRAEDRQAAELDALWDLPEPDGAPA